MHMKALGVEANLTLFSKLLLWDHGVSGLDTYESCFVVPSNGII